MCIRGVKVCTSVCPQAHNIKFIHKLSCTKNFKYYTLDCMKVTIYTH